MSLHFLHCAEREYTGKIKLALQYDWTFVSSGKYELQAKLTTWEAGAVAREYFAHSTTICNRITVITINGGDGVLCHASAR